MACPLTTQMVTRDIRSKRTDEEDDRGIVSPSSDRQIERERDAKIIDYIAAYNAALGRGWKRSAEACERMVLLLQCRRDDPDPRGVRGTTPDS